MKRLPRESVLVVASADHDARAVVEGFERNDLGPCIRIARSADEAIALVRGAEAACEPRLVLLDLGLEDGAAIELARTLRAEQRLRGVPVIALVSEAADGSKLDGITTGTIVKPFEFDAFLRAASAFSLYWRTASRQFRSTERADVSEAELV